MVTGEHDIATDGRHARRERTRLAVVDAVFALVRDGKVPPTVEDVAERAGVSVSSVFRNFDGLDDLQRQAFDRFQEQYAHLLDPAADLVADRQERVGKFVGARLELYVTAGPLIQLARQRAIDYQPMAEGIARLRSRLADHTQRCFGVETARLTVARAADLLAVLDATTSPEAFEVMSAAHARSARQIERSWITAVGVLIGEWADGANLPLPRRAPLRPEEDT